MAINYIESKISTALVNIFLCQLYSCGYKFAHAPACQKGLLAHLCTRAIFSSIHIFSNFVQSIRDVGPFDMKTTFDMKTFVTKKLNMKRLSLRLRSVYPSGFIRTHSSINFFT